jgi:hypothetical protein
LRRIHRQLLHKIENIRESEIEKKFILTNVGEICGCFHASMKSSPSWFYDVKIKKKQEKTRVSENST